MVNVYHQQGKVVVPLHHNVIFCNKEFKKLHPVIEPCQRVSLGRLLISSALFFQSFIDLAQFTLICFHHFDPTGICHRDQLFLGNNAYKMSFLINCNDPLEMLVLHKGKRFFKRCIMGKGDHRCCHIMLYRQTQILMLFEQVQHIFCCNNTQRLSLFHDHGCIMVIGFHKTKNLFCQHLFIDPSCSFSDLQQI